MKRFRRFDEHSVVELYTTADRERMSNLQRVKGSLNPSCVCRVERLISSFRFEWREKRSARAAFVHR